METRIEITKRVLKIENEIQHLKNFMEALKNEDTQHKYQKLTNVFFSKKTKLSLFSLWNKKEVRADFDIPKDMCVDLYVLCQKWLAKLEKQADQLVGR